MYKQALPKQKGSLTSLTCINVKLKWILSFELWPSPDLHLTFTWPSPDLDLDLSSTKTSGVVLSDIPSARASSDAWRMLIFSHLSSLTLCHDRMEGEVDFNVCLRSEHCSLVSGAANIVKILGLPAGWIIHFMRFDARLIPLGYLYFANWTRPSV